MLQLTVTTAPSSIEFARCNATGVIPVMQNPCPLPVGYQLDPEHRVVPTGTEYVKMVGPQVWVQTSHDN